MTIEMKPVAGNTYPIRQQLKDMGGKWDANKKIWFVPLNRLDEAVKLASGVDKQPLSRTDQIAIAARRRGEQPGTCSMCGEKCKYPYTECWNCKEERDMGY